MSDQINPNANGGRSYNFLPKFFQSDANKKFLQATVDQLTQSGTVKKINGYIGRENAKAATGSDIFIAAPDSDRQNYQLEPGFVINDQLGNTTFFKDYIDYINQLSVFGSNTTNHDRINKQEFYSWDPHIDWDKFVNFQQYYWLPYGPDAITITDVQDSVTSEYEIVVESEGDSNEFVFYPNGLTRNPTVKLYRGQTYKFNVNSPGNPFTIKTVRTPGEYDVYTSDLLTNNGTESGTITFTVPYDAPDVLYYVSKSDVDLGGIFQVQSLNYNTTINVEEEIIGKINYTLSNGTPLSNGMKVRFIGNVTPASYATGFYYVEGVGKSIKLINETVLEIVSSYSSAESILFDATPFDAMPFSDATSFSGKRDYIVINRGSQDKNPWSRNNRWFHKSVIEASAAYNGKIPDINQDSRAVRPIIEFEENLKLFNFGIRAIADVDLIDTFTTDVFSNIEGSLGYNVDGIQLAQNQRVLFVNDPDRLVKNNVYKVTYVTIDGVRQIHLELETEPTLGDVVLVKQGTKNQGQMYWFNGSTWILGQQKTSLNQAPYFDAFDSNGYSYSDTDVYSGSTFSGTKLFSYKIGTGTTDSNLGFALSYKNISNIGDIVFNFDLLTDSFQYKTVDKVLTQTIDVGFLKRTSDIGVTSYTNGWQICQADVTQAAVRIYKNTNKTNNFDIDLFDDITDLSDLVVKVYVNGIRLGKENWTLVDGVVYKKVILNTAISTSDVLTIRAFAKQPINKNGYYEIPVNLQNNPFNDSITTFTLGEVSDHVNSIVDNLSTFSGSYPGANNLRDLGDITSYGTKFVQHSGPMSLSVYHITSETNNVVRAIEKARDDYNKFKRSFIITAENLGIDADPIRQVDLILEKINKDKPKTSPYYFSDMVPYGAYIKADLTVVDYRIRTYPLNKVFSLDELSSRAVIVYHNDNQILFGKDYTFSNQGFIVITDQVDLVNGDTITIYEYENTSGSFVPATPTKLGIWPKYEPKKYLDTTLLTPREMIQGHDGSLVLAYGDYRDDLILELEKRIYNNIKVKYDVDIFDVNDLVPSYNKENNYSLKEFNEVLAPSFYKWLTFVDKDFTKPMSYDRTNSFTYNYKGHTAPDGRETPGYWRGVYQWILDTDRPHLCPWEMLGFSEEPTWWTEQYGPAPYTNDNIPMWTDLSTGTIREPNVPPVVNKKYVRPYLLNSIPVNHSGELVSPIDSGLVEGIITITTSGDFVFGDISPIEAAWRRSSYYPFSVLLASMLMQPSKTFGVLLDRSRIVRNIAGQLVYKETGLRLRPADIVLPSIYSSSTNVQTAGIINYIVDYILSDNLKSYNAYQYDLDNILSKLSYRIGAFTSKEKFNLILDSKTPLSQGSVFVPQEDYSIVLNSSSPIKKISYSGVIITKLSDGFELKGYNFSTPYFKYYPWTQNGITVNIGGISETYSIWTGGEQYAAGKIVEYNNKYYRSQVLHTAGSTFDVKYYQALPSLPVVGGRTAQFRKGWDRTEAITVSYGTKFTDVQSVVDFLLGYGEYLKDQGFIFDEFNPTLGAVTNWETSAKEFLFWTTQNWSTGEDKWEDWLPDTPTSVGSIVKYNGLYYRALRNSPANPFFIDEDFAQLDGLSMVGSSVISLSPSASKITFTSPLSVVDDIKNPFNNYEIFKVDGTPLEPNFLNSYREDNAVSYTPKTEDGIYGATFYLIQQEQVAIINNTTIFNDTIYNPMSGYRQERIKVSGYTSADWYGGFDIPGFVFDQAKINAWSSWQDYALGDIVKYKEFYYSAQSFIPGGETFVDSQWVKLDKKPTQELLPNWSYKAGQFLDFYSLDSDNFDLTQQELSQHLVGYQKRQYLDNIIKDDVSEFKFYQGMIQEKGTQNVLNKLFDVLSAEDQESLKFYEEWALRAGQYGASAAFENIEFKLDESQFKNNPQGLELVSTVDTSVIDFIVRQTPNDVYLKPLGYNNNPWPVIKNFKPFLRTPGYVRSNEVKTTLTSIDNILLETITNYADGDYIWCGFEKQDWNVYRYTLTSYTVESSSYNNSSKQVTLTLSGAVSFAEGEYVGIVNSSLIDGFYKVVSVASNTFTISKEVKSPPQPFAISNETQIYTITSQRVSTIDNVDSLFTNGIKPGELVWTDNDGTGKWATWQHYPVYTKAEIPNAIPQDGLAYGRQVLINTRGNIAAITNSQGQIIVYDNITPALPWVERQTITAPFISLTVGFDPVIQPTSDDLTGDVLAISVDGTWLASGTPGANNVASFYVGEWDNTSLYDLSSIVHFTSLTPSKTGFYQVVAELPDVDYPPDTNLQYWKKVPYIPVNANGANSDFTSQGVISIYKKDPNNIFTLVDTILSPNPQTDELFGSSLVFGENTLFVSALGNGDGLVYQLEYKTTTEATASYNPVGSGDTILKVSSVAGVIYPGMAIVGTGFTKGQTVLEVIDSSTLALSAAPDSDPSGTFEFTLTRWQYGNTTYSPTEAGDTGFGTKIAISRDGSTMAINANDPGAVYVYNKDENGFQLPVRLLGDTIGYGSALSLSTDGSYIAIGNSNADTNAGAVEIWMNGGQEPLQTLTGSASAHFGANVSFMNDYATLVVFSNNGTGKIDIYDRYGDVWVFGESIANPSNSSDGYGAGFAVGSNNIFIGAPSADDQSYTSGRVYQYSKINGSSSWEIIHRQIDKPDVSKIKQAFLYNSLTNKLVSYIDVLDPTQGKIPGIAEQEIKYKTYYDPATYYTGTSSVNVDEGIQWGSTQVGMLWWDLRTAKFLDSSDNDIVYRNSTWSTLFPNASIDVYEWVSSTLLPDAWNAIADTEEGLVQGISGTTLYGNDVYSRTARYDNVSKTIKYTYYYWVKNKTTVPNISSRKISSKDVASLIENPRGQGYKYLALTSSNSFSLVNVKPLLQDANVVLSVEYWTVDKTDKNVHTQWKLISNDVNSLVPTAIEQKWIDSLCGKDFNGRVVPDLTLPVKLRYGIENRPLQSMFVNRFEALKQIIEQANRVLIKNQISTQRNLSNIEKYDPEPNVITGMYDVVLDTDAELRLAVTTNFIKPILTPVIVDGRIVDVNIISKGNGYVNPPFIEIIGSGSGAKIKTIINASGQVTGASIIESGIGYDSSTTFILRNYSALVRADSQATGSWSIYAYEQTTKVWSRTLSQTYDTRKYWSYVDWYASGYSQFTAIDYAVNTFAELSGIPSTVGQIVKVLTDSSNNWVLLHKYSDVDSIDWTASYSVVGIENGTIQFSSSLYQFIDSVYGYDGSLYDGSIFDNSAYVELRNILESLKNDIFINELRTEYLNLFFTGLRYAISEQNYVDWAFKTSFVKVQHNVGNLSQKVTYNNDNLSDFESYINEVKPYRTKVREYVSNYSGLDNTKSVITDFDLPPTYQNGGIATVNATVSSGKITSTNAQLLEYPWRHWLDNAGYEITDIKIVDNGTEYISEPIVKFISDSGVGATARAFIANGKVNRIVLLTPGHGYLSAPTIVLDGGLNTTGTPARAVAIIGNSPVRSTLIRMKFDRITNSYFINDLQQTETFTGTGSRLQWPLIWGPDVRIGTSTVTINGVAALRDTYQLGIVKSTDRGYTRYYGSIVFTTAPAKNDVIAITYLKDWSLLNAADRIQFYYDPTVGQIGKDLSQLMTGIDYGGVIVNGMGFETSRGWGGNPYYSDKWDSFDSTFDDFIVTVAADTHSFTLPYTPSANEELNVYHSSYNIDSYVSDGSTLDYNWNIYMNTPLNVTAEITKNVSTDIIVGSDTLVLDDVDGLLVGDILTIPSHYTSVSYTAKVIQIVAVSNTVKMDQVFFGAIPANVDAVFTRTLVATVDYSNPVVGLITLNEPLVAGAVIKLGGYFDIFRIDDPKFGTPEQSQYAVMLPIIATGNTNVVEIPNDYPIADGDKIIIRKSTSDGSIKTPDSDFDTSLTGGSLERLGGIFTTATGKTADEIIVDGDGFSTLTTSSGPEEVVPGQVADTVAIKVFDRPSTGSAMIKVDSFVSDGTTLDYELSQQPNSKDAIIVKTSIGIKEKIADYVFDYKTKTVRFNNPIPEGTYISVFSIGFNGSNILDLDYFVGDGSTKEFITKAPWLDNITYIVYVNGTPAVVELFQTDLSYESSNRTGIRFITPPEVGDLVNFIIVNGNQQTFAITKSEEFNGNGSDTYALANIIGDALPVETSMIVRVDQKILLGPNNSYYTIENNNKDFTIDPAKFVPYSISVSEISVFADGKILTPIVDYKIDLSGITVSITKKVYNKYKNKPLVISVKKGQGYEYIPSVNGTPPRIKLSQAYGPENKIEVISSYNHDILDIQRTIVNITSSLSLTPNTPLYYSYKNLASGLLPLDREVLNDNFVWVVKNGNLLIPSIDFKVMPDKVSIKLLQEPIVSDEFTIISFGNNVLTTGIAYMQFKDILNRVIFKRLSLDKQTNLARELLPTDTTIEVLDASNFDLPSPTNNKPGIIEIDGERIEYFTVNGNILGQLRRGTLGTGVRKLHAIGTIVQEIGASETLPYTEQNIVRKIDSDGTTTVTLDFIPASVNEIEVFVGGVRLKKVPYKVYSPATYPDSPEGDVSFDAEFTVDGATNVITLRDAPIFGTRIDVVKRQGTTWDSAVNIQVDNNRIAQFLKARPGIWYSEIKKT
jgi:hypothetical protein